MRTVVVLTYPGHFLLTKVCLESIHNHISNVSNIQVIVDDISLHAWPTYVDDCKTLYNEEIIPTSQFEFLQCWNNNPWIRQQMVKFYIDKIFANDVFFTDGDCKFFYDVPGYCTPYTVTKYSGVPLSQRDPLPGEVTSQQQNYLNTVLKNNIPELIDPLNIGRKGTTVGTSGCPFRDIQVDVMRQLREYVETVAHNQNHKFQTFNQIHLDFQYNTTLSISEWELYERFRWHVLGHDLNMVFYPPHNHHDKTTYPATGAFFATCFNSDTSLGLDWFYKENISCAAKYWGKLPQTK